MCVGIVPLGVGLRIRQSSPGGLEPVAEGTRVTMDWPLSPTSLPMKIAAPFMGRAMRKATREELELLASYLDG